jgi:DNA-binding winged helix-turn-helix (wHTH) protein
MSELNSQLALVFSDQPLEVDDGLRFQFDAYANSLARLIASQKTRTPLTIGINGEWGSGKTTLMKAIKRRLDETAKGDEGKRRFLAYQRAGEASFPNFFRQCRTIWFNAWKYPREEQLFAALIQEILKQMKREGFFRKLYAEMNDPEQPEVKVPEALISTMSQIFSLGQVDLDLTRFETDSRFKASLAFFDEFQTFFDRLLAWYVSGRRDNQLGRIADEVGVLVIFIDDLDRCLPERTIQTLETIKLFMDKVGAVFVLGADLGLIASAVESHYKSSGIQGLKSHDYLEKIIQIRFDLPPINKGNMQNFISELPDVDERLKETLEVIAGGLNTNPRKIKTFINYAELQWSIIADAGINDRMNKASLIEWLVLKAGCPKFANYILLLENNKKRVTILREMCNFARASLKKAKLDLNIDEKRVSIGGIPVDRLTNLEFKLLETLWQSKGKVVSKDELIGTVYAHDERKYDGVTDESLQALISRLRRKLEANPEEPIYLTTVRGMGYSLKESLSSKTEVPSLSPGLQEFANDDILLRILSRGKYDFTPDNIGLYIHLSITQEFEA